MNLMLTFLRKKEGQSCSNVALPWVGHAFTQKTEEWEGEGGEKELPGVYFKKQPVHEGDK